MRVTSSALRTVRRQMRRKREQERRNQPEAGRKIVIYGQPLRGGELYYRGQMIEWGSNGERTITPGDSRGPFMTIDEVRAEAAALGAQEIVVCYDSKPVSPERGFLADLRKPEISEEGL